MSTDLFEPDDRRLFEEAKEERDEALDRMRAEGERRSADRKFFEARLAKADKLAEASTDLGDAVDAVCNGDAFGDANIPPHSRSVLELALQRFREALAAWEAE
jgi:hypothetical protein